MKHAPADPFTNGPGGTLRFVAVAVPGIAFAAIPFVLITVWLVLFWLLQLPAYGVAWLRSRRLARDPAVHASSGSWADRRALERNEGPHPETPQERGPSPH